MFKFPFDTQVCYVTFGSLSGMDYIIRVENILDHVDVRLLIKNQEFR